MQINSQKKTEDAVANRSNKPILSHNLEGFYNVHANETIVVCGCGTSLNDFTNPHDFITIGVNDVGRKFDPTYLVVLNPRQQFKSDRFSYVEQSRAKAIFTQLNLGIQHPHIVRFKLGKRAGTDFSNPNVLNHTRNSPYVALCLAIHMGAKKIGLIGIDFTNHHFFAKTGCHSLTHQLKKIDAEYSLLAEACAKRGIEVVNLSKKSLLTAFPKKTIQDFSVQSPQPEGLEMVTSSVSKRIFIVHYQFLSCGDVITKGLEDAASDLDIHTMTASCDDPALPGKVEQFSPDLLLVIHGRKFRQQWENRFQAYNTAVWLVDEPYEVDDTVKTSCLFNTVFLNDPSTLARHKNAYYLPLAYNPHIHKQINSEKQYDVGFIGGYNSVREKYLLALADAGLLSYIVGGQWKSAKLRSLCLSKNIPPEETTRLYQKTRIVINVFRERHHFNRQKVKAYSLNPRVYESLACGALVVSEWRPEISDLFPDLPTFKTADDLVNNINKLLDTPASCKKLLSLCRQRLSAHTYSKRLKSALNDSLVNQNYKEETEAKSMSTLIVEEKTPKVKQQKNELPEGWIESSDLLYESNDDDLVIAASTEKDIRREVGITSGIALSQLELSFQLKLDADTGFIAKIHWQDRDDNTSNSYHLISSFKHGYLAKHNVIFRKVNINRGRWQTIVLRRVDHSLLELVINGIVIVRTRDNQLQSGYCFLGVDQGKAELRNIHLRDLANSINNQTSIKHSSFSRPKRSGEPHELIKPLPFSEMPVRNLIYHVWPVRGSNWQWNLEQLKQRIELFNGRRLIGIVHDSRSVKPQEVVDALEGHGCEYFIQPNNPLGEVITFQHMLRKIASLNPNELTFYGHAKGVKYESRVPDTVHRWTEVQYRVSLDNWLEVKKQMEHFALTGPFRMLGRFRTHHNLGDWHYSGTNFWMRHAFVFARDCLDIPQFYGGVEAWPGIYFKQPETGCLFMDQLRQLPYHKSFWSSKATPALGRWERTLRGVLPPLDLIEPLPFQGFSQPRVEQKPKELDWWVSNLIETNTRHLLTIGAMHGGVEWHIARIFRENGRDLEITTVDLNPSTQAQHAFEDAQIHFGQRMRLISGDSSSQTVKEQLAEQYDSVFIDGDHTYRGVCSDWLLAKALQAKLIGFHDIVDSDWHIQCQCGVSKLWAEIKREHRTEERCFGVWGGIGIVRL